MRERAAVSTDPTPVAEIEGRMPSLLDVLRTRAMIRLGYMTVVGASVAAGALMGVPLLAPILGVAGAGMAWLRSRPGNFDETLRYAPVADSEDLFPNLHANMRALSQRLGLKKPPRLTMPTEQPGTNIIAAAMGTSRASAVIIAPRLVAGMHPRELNAVMAHELAHIKYGDTQSQGLIGGMRFATGILWLGALGATALSVTGLVAAPGIGVLAGVFAARVLTVAGDKLVSRGHEWRCDQTAVRVTKDPVALASGLQRLHEHSMLAAGLPAGLERDPGHRKSFLHSLIRTFSTHPPIWRRVKALTGKPEVEPLPLQSPIDETPITALLPGLRHRKDGLPPGLDGAVFRLSILRHGPLGRGPHHPPDPPRTRHLLPRRAVAPTLRP